MEKDWIIRPIVNCLPAWFRFAQCLRRYRDTKEAFPHLVNAGKYSSTFLVVLFKTLCSVYSGENFNITAYFLYDCVFFDETL
jgi:EXS domain-containing protein